MAAALVNVLVYVAGGVFCAAVLLLGRRLIRANKADIRDIVREEVDKLRGEMNERLSAMHEDMRDRMDDSEKELSALRVKLASETGGNSHGLRQAVNEIAADLSRLSGSFYQYVKDHART